MAKQTSEAGDPAVSRELQEAQRAILSGDLAKALLLATELTKAHPEDAEAWNLLGSVYLRSGQDAQALKLSEKSFALDPRSPKYFTRYVTLSIACGYTTRAISDLEDQLKNNPDSYLFWILHGHALKVQNRMVSASHSYLSALLVATEADGEQFAKTWAVYGPRDLKDLFPLLRAKMPEEGHKLHFARCLAQSAIRQGEFETAAQAIETGKLAHPTDPVIEASEIDLLTATGRAEDAVVVAEQARATHGISEDLTMAHVNALWACRQFSDALELCNATLSEQSNFIRLFELTAFVVLSLGEYARAIDILTQIWQLNHARSEGPMYVPSAPNVDFRTAEHHLWIEFDENDSSSVFFLPLLAHAIETAPSVSVFCSARMRLLLQLLFPGVATVDASTVGRAPLNPRWFPIQFKQLVPYIACEQTEQGTFPSEHCHLPEFRRGIARRKYGLAGDRPNIMIDRSVMAAIGGEALHDSCHVLDVSCSQFSVSYRSKNGPGPSRDLTEPDQVASLLSACDVVFLGHGPVAYLAAALGCPTWLMGADEGLPKWFMFNQVTPPRLYPNLHLVGRAEDWGAVVGRAITQFRSADLRS